MFPGEWKDDYHKKATCLGICWSYEKQIISALKVIKGQPVTTLKTINHFIHLQHEEKIKRIQNDHTNLNFVSYAYAIEM